MPFLGRQYWKRTTVATVQFELYSTSLPINEQVAAGLTAELKVAFLHAGGVVVEPVRRNR